MQSEPLSPFEILFIILLVGVVLIDLYYRYFVGIYRYSLYAVWIGVNMILVFMSPLTIGGLIDVQGQPLRQFYILHYIAGVDVQHQWTYSLYHLFYAGVGCAVWILDKKLFPIRSVKQRLTPSG